MKIAHIIPTLGHGGAERIVIELARCTALSGHDVTIFVGWPGDQEALLSRLPHSVAVRPIAKRRMLTPARYASAVAWVWSNRRELESFDVVHCHLTFGAFTGFLLFHYRRLRRAIAPRVVETYHAVGMAIPRLNRWAQSKMAIHRDALVLMAEDPFWERFARNNPRLRVSTIPNGAVDPHIESITEAVRLLHRRELGIPDDCALVVGTVGVLRPDRRPWLYIPIFAELARSFGSEVHFVLAGGGPERERLESLINSEGLSDRVHITGPVSEPRAVLSIMDLYLTLNVGPSTGVAAMEAALAGLPLIGVQMLPSYQPRPDDWIWSSVDSKDVAALAAELLRNQSNRVDLAKRQQEYARKNHTIEGMCERYRQLYVSLVGR